MNQKKTISIIGITVVVIAIVVGFYISQKSDNEIKQQWIVSGPFAISKAQYKIGENVFMTVNNLQPNDIGNIFIVSPQNKTFTVIPFNGTAKDHFNYYFKPDVSKAARITSTDELVGRWLAISDLVKYEPLSFEIINETLPGFTPDEETQIEKLLKPSLNKTG
ncbi:MAG TPA: hypothetical protein VD699_02445 [Nitrosopumilaceae archaeon]|nr:hypothetical protein [Nitrosopumilaceae archaeon]